MDQLRTAVSLRLYSLATSLTVFPDNTSSAIIVLNSSVYVFLLDILWTLPSLVISIYKTLFSVHSYILTSLKLTQHDVSNLTGVSVETLRRIENGRVIPKHETLDLLSPILKEDLNQLLLTYRIDNYYKFKRVINSIESKLL